MLFCTQNIRIYLTIVTSMFQIIVAVKKLRDIFLYIIFYNIISFNYIREN